MSTPADLKVDVPGLTGRIGGPLGVHAKKAGRWFDPVPFAFAAAVFTWLVCMLRQVPCIQTDPENQLNTYLRLCYSDIPILYRAREDFWSGGSLFTGASLEYPIGTGLLVTLARFLTRLFGGVVSPEVTDLEKLQASNLFFGITAVLLFGCFLVTVWAHLQMGRDSASSHTDQVRTRAWDALLIAAAPVVMATGLINWDLLPVALTALAVLLWARKRVALSGVLVGLAFAAKFYPIMLVPVLFLLCLRAAKLKKFFVFLAMVVLSWGALNLPFALLDFDSWSYFWTFNVDRGPDLGSLWYVLTLIGINLPNVSILETVCVMLGGIGIIFIVFSAPRRPRLGQIAALVMIVFLVFNKVYSPQYVLWLLPFVVLARPKLRDYLVFTVAELLYFCAVWGFLEGILGIGSGADVLYWLAVFARIWVQVWLAIRIIGDIYQPWNDPLRTPHIDDPIGGILDHAPDAPFMLATVPAGGVLPTPMARTRLTGADHTLDAAAAPAEPEGPASETTAAPPSTPRDADAVLQAPPRSAFWEQFDAADEAPPDVADWTHSTSQLARTATASAPGRRGLAATEPEPPDADTAAPARAADLAPVDPAQAAPPDAASSNIRSADPAPADPAPVSPQPTDSAPDVNAPTEAGEPSNPSDVDPDEDDGYFFAPV